MLELEALGWLHVEDGNHGEQRPRQNEFGSGNTRFIRAADMDAGRILFDQADVINDAALARIRKGIGMPGDILFSHKGTVGKLALAPSDAPPFVCSPQTTFWRSLDSNKIDQRFLYEYLHSEEFSEQWRARKGETDMADYVSLSAQRQLVLNLPEIRTQRAVGAALGALDDKIAANHSMNSVLERVASAVFTSWFVDFDPVAAKREGKAPVGVPAEAIDLFPSHFEDSEVGPIPQGWRVTRVEEAFELNPKRELARGEVAPYLEMAVLPTAGHSPEGWVRRAAGSGMRFLNGDTLMARITPCLENGKTAFVDCLEPMEVGWGSTEYVVIRAKPPLPLVASYLLARDDDFRSFAIQGMIGSSGRQRVSSDLLGSYKLALPTDPLLMKALGDIVDPLFEMARANASESRTLAELRDTLLGPLLSGDLTINAAETAVGASL